MEDHGGPQRATEGHEGPRRATNATKAKEGNRGPWMENHLKDLSFKMQEMFDGNDDTMPPVWSVSSFSDWQVFNLLFPWSNNFPVVLFSSMARVSINVLG